jgi:protein-tyrosine phosphatase
MIDTDNPSFFSKDMIDIALDFIEEYHAMGWKVLIHCNQGESRGPSIALLYLAAHLGVMPNESLQIAEQHFQAVYPNYHPRVGIREHIKAYWDQYQRVAYKSPCDLQ